MSRRAANAKDRFAIQADEAAQSERSIQSKIDSTEPPAKKQNQEKPKAMQAGARSYLEPPFPAQHLAKPGLEAALELKPMYDAPHYLGSEKLLDKVALITGGGDTPMKRPAQPEEIAPAFVFLTAPSCSSSITGEVLPIIRRCSGG